MAHLARCLVELDCGSSNLERLGADNEALFPSPIGRLVARAYDALMSKIKQDDPEQSRRFIEIAEVRRFLESWQATAIGAALVALLYWQALSQFNAFRH